MKTLYYYTLPIIDLSVNMVLSNDKEGIDHVRTEKVTHAMSILQKSAVEVAEANLSKEFGEEVKLLPTIGEEIWMEQRKEAMAKLDTTDDEPMGIGNLGSREDT